jgi:hypothetical protein
VTGQTKTKVSESLKSLLLILAITSVLLFAVLIPVIYWADSNAVKGVLCGYVVSLANILIAFFSTKWAFHKENKTFLMVFLGGMGTRVVLLISALFFVRTFLDVSMLSFSISLVGFYLLLQVFEVFYVQKQLLSKKAIS